MSSLEFNEAAGHLINLIEDVAACRYGQILTLWHRDDWCAGDNTGLGDQIVLRAEETNWIVTVPAFRDPQVLAGIAEELRNAILGLWPIGRTWISAPCRGTRGIPTVAEPFGRSTNSISGWLNLEIKNRRWITPTILPAEVIIDVRFVYGLTGGTIDRSHALCLREERAKLCQQLGREVQSPGLRNQRRARRRHNDPMTGELYEAWTADF